MILQLYQEYWTVIPVSIEAHTVHVEALLGRCILSDIPHKSRELFPGRALFKWTPHFIDPSTAACHHPHIPYLKPGPKAPDSR